MLQIQILPFPEITTTRCILKEITINDVHDFLELNAEPRVIKYLDRGSLSGVDDAAALIARIKGDEKSNQGIMWKITLKELGPKMVGMIGFWRFMPEHHRAEVAFMLLPEYWNRGLVREALSEVTNYAFHSLKLHSIEANVNPENTAARQMLMQSGFIQEGYFRENYFYDGKFLDTVTFSRLNSA